MNCWDRDFIEHNVTVIQHILHAIETNIVNNESFDTLLQN